MLEQAVFHIARGDGLPTLDVTVRSGDGQPVDLTGCTIRFVMRARGGSTLTVDAAASIVDALAGKVRYVWAAGDTATAGLYDAEFEITFPDGRKMTVPNTDKIVVNIVEDLG